MSIELDSLELRVQSEAQSAATGLDKLIGSLGRLKSVAKGGAGLNTTVNQITKLSKALSSLNSNQGVSSVIKALQPLQSMKKATGFSSAVNALSKIPKITAALSSQELQKFGVQIRLVAKYLAPLAAEMDKVAKGFSALPARIQKVIQANQKLTTSSTTAAKGLTLMENPLTSVAVKLASYRYLLYGVVNFMSDAVMSINDYVENVNLFQVSMGEFYDKAFAYAQLVNEKLGIDPSEWMRTQGVFMSLATGFGVARNQAYALSEGLTELAYDLSSLYNEDVSQSILRLQSALAGEIEPVRRLGIAISEASLKEFALARGINASVESMTEQEKALLRTLKLMEGAANIGAIGDFARTLESPANALRVLNQQITQFKRAVGSVLLPLITQILPYVQAVVELLSELITEFAILIGFTMPTWDASDWGDGLTSGATTATGALEDTTEAVKDLKNATIGIDELNIISPNSSAGSTGSAGGGGWASGLEIPDIWDQEALANMRSQVDALKEQLKPLLDVVLGIGGAFLAWKLSNSFLSSISGLKNTVAALPNLSQVASGLAIVAALVYFAWRNSENFREGLSGVFDLLKDAAAQIGDTPLGKLFDLDGEQATTAASALTMFAGALAAAFGAPVVGSIIAVGGALVGVFQEIGAAIQKPYQGASDLLGVLGDMNISMAAGLGPTLGAFAAVLNSDAVPATDLFGETLSEATRDRVEPLISSVHALDTTLAGLEYSGTIIGDDVIADVDSQLNTIVEMISTRLDANENTSLSAFASLADALGPQRYAVLLEASTSYYDSARKTVADGEAEILSILKTAADNNTAVTEEGWSRITEIQSEMQQLGLTELSESQVEYETIMRSLKDNASGIAVEQASEIIKSAQQTRDETIAAAEDQFSRVLLEAQKMLDVGAINADQYSVITSAARQTRDETVSEAENQYNSIYTAATSKLGELSRFIDENTGDIKSKWTVFWEDVGAGWSTFWDGVKTKASESWRSVETFFSESIPNWWNTTIAPWFTLEKWSGLLAPVKQSFSDMWDGVVAFFTEAIPNWWETTIAPWFTAEKWVGLGKDAIAGLFQGLSGTDSDVQMWGAGFLGAVEAVLGINSPSVEFERIGVYLVEGLARGFGGISRITSYFESELSLMLKAATNHYLKLNALTTDWLSRFTLSINTAKARNQQITTDMAAAYESMAAKSNAAIQSIIDYLDSIPREVTTVHTIITRQVGGSSSSRESISGYASGGFPAEGELFYARENGLPEMVGAIGARTAVANNDQIVEAVSAGVYAAVTSALASQSSRATPLAVYLDGEKIYTNQQQIRLRRGYQISGNPNFAL